MDSLVAHLVVPARCDTLELLLNGRSMLSLPFMNRPLWHQFLTLLSSNGIKTLFLHHAGDPAAIDNDDAEAWGITVEQVLHDTTAAELTRSHMAQPLAQHELILSLASLPTSLALQKFLAISQRHHLLARSRRGYQLLMSLLAPNAGENDWLDVSTKGVYELTTPAQYLGAQLDALEQIESWRRYENILPGRVLAGHHLHISDAVILDEMVLLGDNVRIASRSCLGQSVVGRDSQIGENCDVLQSVIMPGTRIGGHLRLNRKIIDGNRVIDPILGAAVEIKDPQLLDNARYQQWGMQPC